MNDFEKRLLEVERKILEIETKLSGPKVAPLPTEKRISPKEFLLQHKATSEVQTTFLLANYAERILGLSAFNVDDLKQLFGAARVPLPKNLNDVINKNINKGLITVAQEVKDDKKAWVVTITGEQEFINLDAGQA